MPWPFFLGRLLNDKGHVHKKKKKVINLLYSLLAYWTFHISGFLLLRSFCMRGCLCVGVRENRRNTVSFALIVYFMLLLCVLQSLQPICIYELKTIGAKGLILE